MPRPRLARPAPPIRHQRVDLGGVTAVKHGVPWRSGDAYYQLMQMSWRVFIATIAAVFLLINLGFGMIYASMPGAIANAAPGSLADGFFFSVETLATVGYGNMAPATHLGHSVAVVEIMTGLFMTATITGLIFSRFARPTESLIFSNRLVVHTIGERRLLMVRVVGTRARPMADVTAQMMLLRTIVLPNGRIYRRFIDLPLVNQHNAMMGLAWTLAHVLDETSPLAELIDDAEAEIRIAVTVGGLDTLLSRQSFGARNYREADIAREAEFVDIFEDHDDGSIHVDLTRFHDVQPVATTI